MMGTCELAGVGVVLAWCALPILARAAWPRRANEPSSVHARLVLALALAASLFAVPALHALLPLRVPAPLHVAFHILASTAPESSVPSLPLRTFDVSPFATVFALWSLAFIVTVARSALAALRLRHLVARARPAPAHLVSAMRDEARVVGLPPPRIRVSDEAVAPFVAGLLGPVVVLPSTLVTALDDAELALVLRHELAHLRRGDLQVAVFVTACAALFAAHPTARRIAREIRLAREAAVDAEVAYADPLAYATLLVEVASLANHGEKLAHVSMDDTALARRIAMLTERRPNAPRASRRAVILAATIAAALGFAAPAVFAEPPNKFFFKGQDVPPPPHFDDIRACFEAARKDKPDLTIETNAGFELDKDGKVLSASVPTPESPTFQRCVEDQALAWTFPPPPDAPKPPPDAKLHVMLHLVFPEK